MSDKIFELFINKVLFEQDPNDEEVEEGLQEEPTVQKIPAQQQEPPPEVPMNQQDPYGGQGEIQPGMDPYAGEIEDPNAPVDRTDIGKVYEISRIYSRLVAINNVLKYFSNPELDDLKYKVSEAIEMFNIIITRFDDFLDDIDKISEKYTKFILKITDEIDAVRKRLPSRVDLED